jgi:hypothetical protein
MGSTAGALFNFSSSFNEEKDSYRLPELGGVGPQFLVPYLDEYSAGSECLLGGLLSYTPTRSSRGHADVEKELPLAGQHAEVAVQKKETQVEVVDWGRIAEDQAVPSTRPILSVSALAHRAHMLMI